jgi:hypothetical protein
MDSTYAPRDNGLPASTAGRENRNQPRDVPVQSGRVLGMLYLFVRFGHDSL